VNNEKLKMKDDPLKEKSYQFEFVL